MSTPTIEIGGSQGKLAEVLLASDEVVTLTRDGQPVGTFIPTPTHQKTNEEAVESFIRATDAIRADLESRGITEDDIWRDIEELHAEKKRLQCPPKP